MQNFCYLHLYCPFLSSVMPETKLKYVDLGSRHVSYSTTRLPSLHRVRNFHSYKRASKSFTLMAPIIILKYVLGSHHVCYSTTQPLSVLPCTEYRIFTYRMSVCPFLSTVMTPITTKIASFLAAFLSVTQPLSVPAQSLGAVLQCYSLCVRYINRPPLVTHIN